MNNIVKKTDEMGEACFKFAFKNLSGTRDNTERDVKVWNDELKLERADVNNRIRGGG